MATSFKTLLPEDIATTRTLLHEAIPVTGTIPSGTYVEGTESTETNIKEYSHGMFQSVYDYPYLSSSANHIFDITWGYASGSSLNASNHIQNTKKVNIYQQMALILRNRDIEGNIKDFDRDGAEDTDTTDDMREAVFLSFARLLNKDEIKKDSFRLQFFSGSTAAALDPVLPAKRGGLRTLGDYEAQTNYKTNSPAGEYGLLYTSSANIVADSLVYGHIYYQAGIAVITASVYEGRFGSQDLPPVTSPTSMGGNPASASVSTMLQSGTINQLSNAWRFGFYDLDFNNTTELNSTIYFTRAHNTEFNYSANSTYVSASEIVIKGSNPAADPVAYITSVGLYSPDNELLATAKLSEPLKKSPSNEITLRVRLDY